MNDNDEPCEQEKMLAEYFSIPTLLPENFLLICTDEPNTPSPPPPPTVEGDNMYLSCGCPADGKARRCRKCIDRPRKKKGDNILSLNEAARLGVLKHKTIVTTSANQLVRIHNSLINQLAAARKQVEEEQKKNQELAKALQDKEAEVYMLEKEKNNALALFAAATDNKLEEMMNECLSNE